MMSRDAFCGQVCRLREVAKNWATECLDAAEDAAMRGDFEATKNHCSEAIEAARVAQRGLEEFVADNRYEVPTLPVKIVDTILAGNEEFVVSVRKAAYTIAQISLEVHLTSRQDAQA